MGPFTFYLCNPEAALHAQLAADTDREWLEYQRAEDLDCEEQLAREAVEDDATDSWPAYADAPLDVEEPEVVEDADLLGLPVDAADVDFDDELTVEALDNDAREAR